MRLYGKNKLLACDGIVTILFIGRPDRECKTACHYSHNAALALVHTLTMQLLPKFAQAHLLVVVLIQDLCGGQFKVFLRHVNPPLS